MLKYVISGFLLTAAAVLLYQGPPAMARDLFIKKSHTPAQAMDKLAHPTPGQKKLGNGRELFNRSGKNVSPYMSQGLRKTGTRIEEFKMPASWALLDQSSRDIKMAGTKAVIMGQMQKAAEIDKQNAKSDKDLYDRVSKQQAEEKATENSKPGKKTMTPEEIEKIKKAGGKKTKDNGPKKGNVIKRAKDPNKGMPRKLFNSP